MTGSMNPAQHKLLTKLKNMILSTGRHSNVDSIVIRQDFLGGNESKFDHLQSQYMGYFPLAGSNREEVHYTFAKKMRLGPGCI